MRPRPVIPALESSRQEEFRVILSYIVSSRPTWTMSDLVSKKEAA